MPADSNTTSVVLTLKFKNDLQFAVLVRTDPNKCTTQLILDELRRAWEQTIKSSLPKHLVLALTDDDEDENSPYVILSNDAPTKDFYPNYDVQLRIYLDVYDIQQIKA